MGAPLTFEEQLERMHKKRCQFFYERGGMHYLANECVVIKKLPVKYRTRWVDVLAKINVRDYCEQAKKDWVKAEEKIETLARNEGCGKGEISIIVGEVGHIVSNARREADWNWGLYRRLGPYKWDLLING